MAEQMRQAEQGPDKPVSFCMDNWRNVVSRYETPDEAPRITVKLSADSPVSEAEVREWYWHSVGEWDPNAVISAELPDNPERPTGY